MPSNTTHRIFGKSVLNKIPIRISNKITNKYIYNVFCQSFDNLFYYNLISFKKGKKIREFARYCHRTKTQAYLINIIKYIKDSNLKNDSDCLAYLYGSINHYVLDTTFHPFVFYKTGAFNKNKKETYKYNSLHTRMESMLDKYFYDKENLKPYYNYRHYKDDFPKVEFSTNLNYVINNAFKKTYNKDNIAKIYYKSFNQGRFIFRFGVYDKYGLKKLIYRLIDFVRPLKYKKIIYVSSYVNKIDSNYLNLDKQRWYNSATDNYSNLSVDELYDLAVDKSVEIIKEVDNMLETKLDLKKLKKIIPNISYISGINIYPRYYMNEFEF